MKKFSLVILSLDGSHKSLNCNFPHETLIVKTRGWGKARCFGIDNAQNDFVVMVNGDVEVKAEAWPLLFSCKHGEFFMANHNGGACSRIFAIHREDCNSVCFNSSLKYIFEDGDFYVRALAKGFKCHIVPSNLYVHPTHYNPILFDFKQSWFLDWEYSRMFAKYSFFVRRDLFNFFIQPFSVKRVPNMILRVYATLFWVARGWF